MQILLPINIAIIHAAHDELNVNTHTRFLTEQYTACTLEKRENPVVPIHDKYDFDIVFRSTLLSSSFAFDVVTYIGLRVAVQHNVNQHGSAESGACARGPLLRVISACRGSLTGDKDQ